MRSTSSNRSAEPRAAASHEAPPLRPAAPPLRVVRLGRRGFAEVLALQHELVAARGRGEGEDVLLLVEHDDVVTVGRGAGRADAGATPFPVHEVERGGEATWHGPGQLVGYPIVRLEGGERDLHRVLRALEDALIATLGDLGVRGERLPPHTGVWAGGRKLASLGIAVRRWVTFHGFALNVAVDLAAFRAFRPCGLSPDVMESLHRLLRPAPALDEVGTFAAAHVARALGRRPVDDGTRPAEAAP